MSRPNLARSTTRATLRGAFAALALLLAWQAKVPAPPSPPGTPAPPSLAAAASTAAPTSVSTRPSPPAQAFTFDVVRARAQALAQAPYVPPAHDDLPEWLAKLDYDGYRQIHFRPETSLWAGEGLPFHVDFAHRGYLYKRRVPIWVVDGARVQELRFSKQQFVYGPHDVAAVPDDLGYAGFAVRYPLDPERLRAAEAAAAASAEDGTTPAVPRYDEVAAFRGASYFRLLGKDQVYGASLRGLAIDTASPNGEEFPEFVELWLEKPLPGAPRLTIYALLDSPSTTGAYRFVIAPGAPTVAEVSVSLFSRHKVTKLGLAPLTSMFLFGEARLRSIPDWRPEVHDSDGLLAAAADGTWLWRPLRNPTKTHRVTRLPLDDPRGFGLVQRDRRFASYEDLESRFEARPSYWITPRGSWGKGALELVEIPTQVEWNDNVVAYWVPEQAPDKGQELRLEYEIAAYLDDAARPPLARTRSVRVRPGEKKQLFVIDFEGPQLAPPAPPAAAATPAAPGSERPAEPPPLRAQVDAPGKIENLVLHRNDIAGGQRCAFELTPPEGDQPIEIRVSLRRGERAVSETLVLHWGPQ